MWPRIDGLRVLELGTPGAFRDELNSLVLSGAKRATAGLAAEYRTEGEVLEHVGEHLVLVDNDGARLAEVEITSVEECPFGEVSWDFADSEGEGFRSIEHWREGHSRYWGAEGHRIDSGTEVVCLRFRLTG
jgi:uncharacterized protein YhfF